MATKRPSVLVRMTERQKEILAREAGKAGMSMNDVICHFIDWMDTLKPGQRFVAVQVAPPTGPTVPQVPHIEGQTEITVEEQSA